jgi:hypothetical protein
MADSVGAGISRGLQGGINMVRQLQADRDQREDRRLNRERQMRMDAQAEDDRTRRIATEDRNRATADDDQLLKTLDDERAGLRTQAQTLVQQYGAHEKVPAELMQRLSQRIEENDGRRSQVRQRRLGPLLEAERRQASTLFADIRSGKVALADVDDAQLYRAIGVVTRRDPMELIRDGNASPLGGAIQNVIAQMETRDNPEQLLAAVNTVLAPELRRGIGSRGRDGSEIIGKEIVRLVPAPGGGDKLLPVLKVAVRRADGATGSYLAPVTKGRSSSGDDDEVVQLGLGDAMDYLGRLASFEELANAPGLRDKIVRGAQAGRSQLDQFLEAYSLVGAAPHKRKTTTVNIDRGNVVTRITEDRDTGEEIRREDLARGVDPTRQAVAETYAESRERSAGISAAARAAPGTGGGRPLSEAQVAQRVKNAEGEQAKRLGLTWNTDRKAWLTADGKKAGAEQMHEINQAGVRARQEADRLTQTGRAQPAPKVDDATKTRLNEIRAKAGLPPL